jgi:hypothetical protein
LHLQQHLEPEQQQNNQAQIIQAGMISNIFS